MAAAHDRHGCSQKFGNIGEVIEVLKPRLETLKRDITSTSVDGARDGST